ncbi:MAG TPA: DJ-1/PfpI family protein [Methanocorpusculum sp.]|nr:DJ-1/PfpI family protein [Methanocorpusculum sp.]
MPVLYLYVLNTLADWEIGYLTAEVNSRRFFKYDAPAYKIRFAGSTLESVKTMGGISITPDCLIREIIPHAGDILVLPGADTWNDTENAAAVVAANRFLEEEKTTVAAICGATAALAGAGLLDNRPHTSNGVGFLDMFVPTYRGKEYYMDELSVNDGNLITAGSAGGLLFAKQILKNMGVMSDDALNAWYEYFKTGDAGAFFRLMSAVQT